MTRYPWLAMLVALLLAACGGEEHTDLKQWMRDASKDLKGRVPPLPEVKPFPAVSYSGESLIDPFRISRIEPEPKPGGSGARPDPNRRKEPLENYPLESLKFVGLLRNDKSLVGAVLADKSIHNVKVGNFMGQNHGEIIDIQASPLVDEGKIVLREKVQDSEGDWSERLSTLELQVQEVKQ